MLYNIVVEPITRPFIDYDIKNQYILKVYIDKLIEAEKLSGDLNSYEVDALSVLDSSYDKILTCSCLLNDKIVEIMAMRETYPEVLSM